MNVFGFDASSMKEGKGKNSGKTGKLSVLNTLTGNFNELSDPKTNLKRQ